MKLKTTSHLPTEKEAEKISRKLLEEELAAGTLITETRTQYIWKEELRDENYWKLEVFTSKQNRKEVESTVKDLSSEEVPAIYFDELKGTEEFEQWIKNNS